jgi:hypothetical protein
MLRIPPPFTTRFKVANESVNKFEVPFIFTVITKGVDRGFEYVRVEIMAADGGIPINCGVVVMPSGAAMELKATIEVGARRLLQLKKEDKKVPPPSEDKQLIYMTDEEVLAHIENLRKKRIEDSINAAFIKSTSRTQNTAKVHGSVSLARAIKNINIGDDDE